MPRYRLPITHRPERDGTAIESAHVPYYLALEVAADAWGRALVEACGDLLGPRDLAVVHAECDFRRELFIGDADLDVTLIGLGSSSLRWHIALSQHGLPTGTVVSVVCRVNVDRVHALPLSEGQRAGLQAVLVDPTAQSENTAPFQ